MSQTDHNSPPEVHLDSLATEDRNPNTANIDRLSTLELVRVFNDEDHVVADAVKGELTNIAMVIDLTSERMADGGRLIYIGAGTSGRLGVLDASECPPTFGTPPGLVVGVIAGGDHALRHAIEAVEDSPDAGASSLDTLRINAKDTVIGIAASGRTPFVIGALKFAENVGAATVGLCNTANSEISRVAEVTIAPVVGGEVVTGSTRLKAGTAQKMVLNMISTGVMIRLGKTYGNLMVDLHASNAKLDKRAIRIIRQAAACEEDLAIRELAAAGGSVKVAIVAIRLHVDSGQARRHLESAGGNIRVALGEGEE